MRLSPVGLAFLCLPMGQSIVPPTSWVCHMFLAFHCTHLVGWDMGGSSDLSLFSSSVVSGDPCKKDATSAWSWGGSPKSESSDPIPLKSMSGLADWLAVGWPLKLALHHLFLLLSSDP